MEMQRPNVHLLRAAAVVGAAALLVTGCGTDWASPPMQPGSAGGTQLSATSLPRSGGTIYILIQDEQWDQVDPQRLYGSDTLAFFGATIYRSLVSYTYSADAVEAYGLVPDMATDTGRASADARTWSFTLRDGLTFQDGSPITCEDVRYGVSRTFATDVINYGPTYAIVYLDIPGDPNADNGSQYPGPFTATADQQALFDQAVVCDGNAITFHLNPTVADFNYATTLGMYPVKQSADTGASYGQPGSPPPNFLSSGPYQVKSYTTGVGGKMILERNPYWDAASDPVRKALPDGWEVDFGLDPVSIDQRLMASSGADAMAVADTDVQAYNLPTIFVDPHTANPNFAGRAFSGYTPYVTYFWINTQKVPNELQRQAIAVALDRGALRSAGEFGGEIADGVIPPNMGIEYAPTGWATDMFGEPIPPGGNPDLARRLIAQSGEPMPDLTFDYHQGPVPDSAATIVKNSLARAGINVTANPMGDNTFWATVWDDETVHEFGLTAWGFDWPNASTIIPLLFTGPANLFNLSRVHDPDFVGQVQDALTTIDRQAQAAKWQALNKTAMQRAYVVPVAFLLSQTLGGTRVAPLYPWAPYATWPFAEMGVLPE
jgi:peptide/nickel transport system substrate-binding protein